MSGIGWPELLLILCWVVVFGLGSGYIAHRRGHRFSLGLGLGVLFGVLGLIGVLVFLRRDEQVLEERLVANGTHKRCAYCKEIIRADAMVCKHCGRDV